MHGYDSKQPSIFPLFPASCTLINALVQRLHSYVPQFFATALRRSTVDAGCLLSTGPNAIHEHDYYVFMLDRRQKTPDPMAWAIGEYKIAVNNLYISLMVETGEGGKNNFRAFGLRDLFYFREFCCLSPYTRIVSPSSCLHFFTQFEHREQRFRCNLAPVVYYMCEANACNSMRLPNKHFIDGFGFIAH